MKYVRFAWPPFEVAVSIFNVSPSIKTSFFDKESVVTIL